MLGECRAPPLAAGELIGIGRFPPKAGEFLLAHALDRVRIEARAGQRQPQQFKGLVTMLVERAQRPAEIVAANLETHFDGVTLEALMERLGIEVAGTLVEHGREEVGEPLPAQRVLGAAAFEGEAHRDQRHTVLFDQPSLDPAGAFDTLDFHCVGLVSEYR